MHDPHSDHYIAGVCCILIGSLGWVLPYRWNILRIRRPLSRLFSESVNLLVPKIIGTAAILSGVVLIVGAALGWDV